MGEVKKTAKGWTPEPTLNSGPEEAGLLSIRRGREDRRPQR